MYILSCAVPVMYKMYIYLPSCVNMYYIYLQASSECIYVHIPHPTHCILSCSTIGDPKVPFLKTPAGFLHIDDSSWQNKIASTIIFGPNVLIVQNCKYLPTTTCGWFYPSNPKSQSRRLLSICIILFVLAYFVCFLGALARGFFL